MPPNTDFNPTDLKSWAKRTGFNVSGESAAVTGEVGVDRDLETGERAEIESAAEAVDGGGGFKEKRRVRVEPRPSEVELKSKNEGLSSNGNGAANGISAVNGDEGLKKEEGVGPRPRDHADIDWFQEPEEPEIPPGPYKSGLVCGVTESPGYG